jgi:ABC-type glycerol-3-phosphate transport system permease component
LRTWSLRAFDRFDRRVLDLQPALLLRGLLWLAGMTLALLWIAPIIWMISTSFKPPGQVMSLDIQWLPRTPTLENYEVVFRKPIGQWFLNSVIVSVGATLASLATGAMAGYALARLHFPGRQVVFLLAIMALMIPTEMTIVPVFIGFLKLKLVNNYLALILPSLASVFSVYLFRQFFLTLPSELEDAAAIDGCNRFQSFWFIALPLARPALIAGTILLFSNNWNAFLWPLLVMLEERWKTLPVGVATFAPGVGNQTQILGFGPAMAAVTLLALPSLLVFLALQRYFIEGVARTGVKG